MTKEEMQMLLNMFDERLDNKLDEKFKPMIESQNTIKSEILKINTKIDHDIDRSIKVTMEGHAVINRKLDELIGLDGRVETLEDKVSAIEYVVGKAK